MNSHIDALISTIPSLISIVIGIILIFKQRGLHLLMNSRLTELLESVKKTSHAEGKEEQRLEEIKLEKARLEKARLEKARLEKAKP